MEPCRKNVVRLGYSFLHSPIILLFLRGCAVTGYIHSIETLGTVDGPGIRFVAFMQGCPMRCKYCHNPDTWALNAGKEISAEELAATALKYKSYIKNGGVTVSGGEPLLQIEFVTEFFKILKAEGIHTALDTSGITFNEKDKNCVARHKQLLKYTDLVLLDIKHIDENGHKKLTGFSNENPLSFAKYLSDNGKDMWVRHVLVSGVTDNDVYLNRLAEFINGLKTVKNIEVLPYHSMGESKYQKLGINYSLKGAVPPDKTRIENAVNILNSKGNT
ncbi:MAG: pyruvate formate lyase-activating protein [Clostridia bacterium]|nr:pyruvate formate lyase-activating protein [Clostridia bacterium]